MKKKIFFLISVSLVVFNLNLLAQELWSLEECINHAYEHNLTIKQSQLDVLSADIDLKQSKLNLIPSLNAGASENFNWGRNLDPQTNLYDTKQA